MLTIDKTANFKVERRKLQLPKPEGNKGNLIFLPYMTPVKCGEAIKKSTMFARMSYWKNIFREHRFMIKLFNKQIRYNNMRERNEILDTYMDNDRSLKGIKNITLTKNKNCYIDISNYMVNFFNFHRKSWKLTLSEFFKLMSSIISKEEYAEFNRKIILLNINCWDTDKVTVINKYNILNNPFSIIYLALRKNFALVQSLGNVEIFITDGANTFFKFNPVGVDKSSYLDFKLCLAKIKPSLLEKDLDNDAHLDTYGTTSSNAPKEELDKAKAELHAAENVADKDDEVQMSLMDEMERLSGRLDSSEANSDDEEPEEDDELETSEDEEDQDNEGEAKESEEEKENKLEQELLAELNVDDDTAAEVQKVLARKVPDKPVSARERQLKEKQLQLKLESGKTLAEILDQAKNNPSYKKVDTTEIDDKIRTLNKSMTKVTFPNFEKSYNDQVFEHDFYGVFNSLSEKNDLPVYIRKVTKEDSSDSLNLKETYTFELEDPEYHRKMSFKIDVPKFVEGKFMYLSGNKKMFVKQLILKPVVKIAQDTVQICSNYSKIFMHRYGDNVSPVTQNIIKILSSNTKYFSVVKGNSIPLNKEYKTALEYDAIAKYIMIVKIKNSKVTFFFSQKHLDEYIKKNQYDDLLKGYDRDRFMIIGLDETDPKHPQMIEMTTDDADIAAADFNNGEDVDPGPMERSVGNGVTEMVVKRNIVDTILEYAHKHNPSFDISNLLTESGIKTSKKYIFSRCVIMKKKVPTIFLLSYAEGLTTVLRKANINYTFQQERPKFESNYAKLERGVIPFADGYLVFDRYPIQNSLLLNAFSMLDTKAYDFEDMDRPDVFADIFALLYGARQLASAFDAFYDNMIDPITKEMLESMNYPTTFVPLLLFANNLLCDNSYTTEINMNNFRVRSNEMVNAMLYKIVSTAYSNYKRTAMNRSPMTISVPRGALIKEIVTSQSVEDYSRLNPILEADKSRAVTCKGPSGINLEQSYTEEKRCFDKSMTGLLAMATSPDGNCGVVRQLTVDPKLKSPRGFIDMDKNIDDMTEAELFAASDLAIPGAARSDDSIRTSMMFKQN